jgi:hypothetical protein
MDFAIDPALFGVAGPSTSSTGRVREVPSLLQQHEEAKTSTRIPLLSDSGSSDDDDEEEDEDEEDEDEEDGDEEASDSDASSEEGQGQSNQEGDASRIPARDKGKGKAKETKRLPPLPPGMDPNRSAMYADTDGETDHARASALGSHSQRNVSPALSSSTVSTLT